MPIDPSRTSCMLKELNRRVQDTQVFLRMAAIELRRIAERAPDVAAELQNFAHQLEAEAADLIAATATDAASENKAAR